MERCCRSVRFMLRCVSQQVQELLGTLVGQIVRIYSIYKHSCFLYVGSILVDEYATDMNCVSGLLDMLQAFLEPTFQLLQEENGLRNHPDTVDDFFRLCARFMQRSPIVFLQCPFLRHILQCALTASTLDHKVSLCFIILSSSHTPQSFEHGDADNKRQNNPISGVTRKIRVRITNFEL